MTDLPGSDGGSRPGAPAAWLLAARPKTLPVAIVPVIVGTVVAYAETGAMSMQVVVIAGLCALLIQIATNLHNDVADFRKGADDPSTRIGPRRATAEGWLDPATVQRVSIATFLAAFFIGLYLVRFGGLTIFVVGVVSIIAGYAYSGGPRPISHTCLGELFVWLFFGLVAVGGTYFLHADRHLSVAAVLAGACIGLPAAAVLVVNNTRDVESDRMSGRRTFPVRFGTTMSLWQYMLFVYAAPMLAAVTAWAIGSGTWSWICLAGWSRSFMLSRRFSGADTGPQFNDLLARTARFAVELGGLLVLVLLVSAA
jgi:1,4-dihydroxy-2-naphthoate octaprenyltransferase